MPKLSRQARRTLTEERRKQILDAAARVFAQKGYERATIAEIARAAGIAEGSIYNYFKNKGDVLINIPRQAIQPTVETMSARMTLITSDTLPPKQMLITLAHNMIATIHQNAHIFRILLSTLPTMPQTTRDRYLNQTVLYVLTMLEAYFNQQIKRGVFRRDLEPRTLARAFVGLFFPFILIREVLQVESENDWTYDEIIHTLVPLFLRGVMADAPKRKSK